MDYYDYLIIGSGPIGASAAYFSTKHLHGSAQTIALLTNEPTDDHSPTYHFAGGSVRSFWPDARMTEMTTETTEFLTELAARGIEIGLRKDQYAILHRGAFVPSLNVTSAKVVEYFLDQARADRLQLIEKSLVKRINREGDVVIVTDALGRTISARRVLVAIGAALPQLFPDIKLKIRKRQLFVLNTPIPPEREHFPHTIVPFAGGFIFLFLKKIDGEIRLLLGQEDVRLETLTPEPEDYFTALLEQGVSQLFPFIQDARVERILWGFDYDKKHPLFLEPLPGVQAVVCGSAVRSCVWIGRKAAELLCQ